jgi:hypothetical protein
MKRNVLLSMCLLFGSCALIMAIAVWRFAFPPSEIAMRPQAIGQFVTEAGQPLSSVFDGIPREIRFKDMGRVPLVNVSCRENTLVGRLRRLVRLETVYAEDCYGAYFTQDWVDCLVGCLVDEGRPMTYTDSTNAPACSGHQIDGPYCGACGFQYDTAGCDPCS